MKTLHLVLKSKWYDMIDRGEKNIMLLRLRQVFFPARAAIENVCRDFPRGYTHVCFHKGYTSTMMTFTVESIKMGEGNPEWGAPTAVFIIKLGERL